VEKTGVGTLRLELTGTANAVGYIRNSAGTLDLNNTTITLNRNDGESQNPNDGNDAKGLITRGALTTLRGSSVVNLNRGELTVVSNAGAAGHLVMSGTSSLIQNGAAAEGGNNFFVGFGGFTGIEFGSTMTMKDNSSWTGRVNYWDMHGTFNMQNNAILNLDFPIPNSSGQYISAFFGRVGRFGNINVTDSASMTARVINMQGSSIFHQTGNTTVVANTTQQSDGPGGTWTVSGNSTFSMPTARYTATAGRFGLRKMNLNIAGAGAMVDLSNSIDDRSLFMATNAGENAALNLQSGTLVLKTVDAQNAFLVNPNNGQQTSFNFLGGTLKAAQASIRNANLLGNNGLGSAVIYQAGAVVDTNGHDATITQPLLAASGSGVLTIPVLNGGSGYKYAPTVAFAGGVLGWSPTTGKQLGGAQVIVNLTNGSVSSVSIINPGGYVDTSTLSFSLMDHNTGGGGGAVLGTPTFGANNTTGGLTKQGAGTLTLSALSTYTGTTAVTNGALLARHARALGTGNVTVAAGTGLSYLAAADSPLAIGGTLAVTGGAGATLGTSLGALPTSAQINVTGAASASGNVDLRVFGTPFTPTTGLAATYTLVQGGAGSSLNGAAYTPIAMNPTNFTLSNLAVSPALITIDVTSQPALAGPVYWQGTATPGITNVWAASNGNVATPDSNWTAVLGGPVTPLVPGAGADVVISNAPVISAPTGTRLGADMTIRTLTIADTANGLGLNADPHFLTITPANPATGITMNIGVPASTIATNIRLGASQTWTNNSANPLTVSGGVLEATALTNLIKEGTGTVILSGATLHTGFTDVRDGTLQLTGTAATPGTLSTLTTLNLGNGANSGRFILGGPNSKYFQQNIFNLSTTGSGTSNAIVGGNTIPGGGEHIAPVLRVDGGGSTFAGLLGSGILGNTTENYFNFTKGGNGTTTLTNASSTFTGVTSAFGGVLSVSSIANAGVASSIGAWATAGSTVDVTPTRTAGLLLATGTGGAFRYTGATASSDRGFALQGASVIDVDSASALTFGASALGGNGYTFIVNGTVGSSLTLGATTIGEGAGGNRNIASHSTLTIASITEVNDILVSQNLPFRGLGTGTVSGAVSQNQAFSLNVFKEDGGTWNLNGTNTYTGQTTVNGGLLRINGSTPASSGTVTVGSAGGLGGTGTISGAVNLSGRIDLGNGSVGTLTLAVAPGTALNILGAANANSLIFDLASGGTTTDVIAVTNAFNMTNSGAGVVVPNQLGGAGNRLTAGTYDIMTAPSGDALDVGATKFKLETTKAFGQTFSLAASTATALKLSTNQVAAGPGAVTLAGASWNVAGNFGGTLPEYNSNVTIDSALASTLDSSTDINSLTYGPLAVGVTIAPGAVPAGTPASMLVLEAGGITSGGTGTHSISAKVGLAASQTWTVNTDLTVSGVVSDFGGEYSLTKAGTGVLTLSGANTYAGNTTVSAGTLKLNNATALGRTTGAVSVAGTGAVLDLNGQTMNNASLTINGTGIATGGALISSTGTGTVNSTVVMASDSSIGGVGNLILNSTDQTRSGMLRGNFNLTKVGTGTLQLNAANSFGSSATTFTISQGTVQLGNPIGLGNAANNVSVTAGAMLNLNNQQVLNTNPLTINGTGVSSGGALQNGTYAGPITLGSNSSIVGNNNTILLNSGGITGGFNLELGGTGTGSRIDSTIATGAGTLTKVGAGWWTLRGANTYSGGTTLTLGTLQFMKAVSMPAFGTVAVGAGTTLAVNVGAGGEWTTGTTGAGTLGGLLAGVGGQGAPVTYAAGTITLGIDTTNASIVNVASGAVGTVTSRFHDTAVQTYSGVIANPVGVTLGLNKLGLNTLALTGANSYTGVTTVTGGGVLQVSNLQNGGFNSSIGNFAAGAAGLVLNGGTLQYTGGTTAIDRGFTLAADNSIIDVNTPGTALTLGASSLGAFRFAATGSAGSSLNLGAATLTGNATLVGGIPLTITSLTGAGQDVVLGGDVTVTTATFSGNATIRATNGRVTLNTLANTATNTITLRGAGTSSGSANNNGNNLSLGIVSNPIINGNAGAAIMSITKDDAGIWAFSNANTYTGETRITNGVLRLDHATALPGGITGGLGGSALTFNGGNNTHGVLGLTVASGDFTRGLGSGVNQVQFTERGGWAAYGADRVVNLGGAGTPSTVVWATATTGFNNRQLNLGASSATHTVDLQNPIDLGSAVRTVQVEDGPADIEAKMSGVLSGVGGALTKIGSGKLLLSGNNSYDGVTTVILGTLVVTNSSALGTTAGATAVGFFAGSGTTTGNLGATLDVQANIGTEPLNVGGFGVGGIGALITSTGTGTVGGTVTLTSASMLGGDGNLNIDGVVSGGFSMTKVGAGTLTLTNTNIYNGTTNVSGGTLTVASTGSINNTSEVLIGAANFKYNSTTALSQPVSFSATGGILSGTGTITPSVTVTPGNTLSPGASAGPISFGSGLTISAGGILNWEHTAGNAVGTSGTSWDVVNVTGTTTISNTASTGSNLNLKFSTGTDFTNAFWDGPQTWKFIVGGVSSGNLFDISNLDIFVNELPVGTGNTIAGEGAFSTVVNGTDLDLKWTASGATASYATWAAAFTAPTLSNQAADADPDNDGLTNAYEYIHGSDPRYTNQGGPTGSIVGTDLVLTFTRTDIAETPDVSLLVQVSTDLSDWTSIAGIPIGASSSAGVLVTEGGAADDIITVTIPKLTDLKKFARLIVVVTP
jgi:autotransporter-associated beta strand protein